MRGSKKNIAPSGKAYTHETVSFLTRDRATKESLDGINPVLLLYCCQVFGDQNVLQLLLQICTGPTLMHQKQPPVSNWYVS